MFVNDFDSFAASDIFTGNLECHSRCLISVVVEVESSMSSSAVIPDITQSPGENPLRYVQHHTEMYDIFKYSTHIYINI